uniref:NADH dehydrogenase subunit 2 n=1 Tax=Agriotes fuscicollis TaxID=941251 RepID=UPI002000B1AA|nr:NADH dehydrogenase subunit 2 [Agriotes fuscicollis]UNQ87631.1 NADH dehydrogenase subunit 2 [Agriotes fuscicollis]
MSQLFKLIFLSMVFISTLISVSSYSWLGMWLGLEINLLSIIPLMQSSKSSVSSEASIKYFIVQAIASSVILVSLILMMLKSKMIAQLDIQLPFSLMMNSALLTKMGTAPFHFWFPEVLEGLDWMNCLLLLTWQKIAPMVLITYNSKSHLLLIVAIISSMIISGLMGINQVSIRKILAYSSLNHMGWMISTLLLMETIWLIYFSVYAIMTLNLILFFNKYKIFYINQLNQSMNENSLSKFWFMLNFLSLSGVPPFLGFLPKWLTIQALVMNGMLMLPVAMIIFTLVTIFIYIRITLSTLLMNASENNWNLSKFKFNSMFISIFNFISISSLILVTVLFNIS